MLNLLTLHAVLSSPLQLSRDNVLFATVKRIMERSHSLPEEETQLCEEVVSLLHQMGSLTMAIEVSMWVVERLHSRKEKARLT